VKFVAGHGGLADDVIGQIVSKTDGVPLFIEEVTKAVLARSETGPDRTEGTSTAVPTVPETLHDSLMARLDRLAPMKAIAQAAAAIGREFEMNLLESVASAPPKDVRTAIEGLQEAGLLFRRGQQSGETYAFKHALVQDAAYASMLRDDRKNLHRRIATALHDKFSELAASQPELLAHHFAQAGELKSAISYWLKAGQQASRRSAFVEATTHLQMALKHLPDLPDNAERDQLELQLLQSLASASIAARGFGAAETMQALNRALQLCEKSSGPSLTFPVLNGMVGVHMMRGEFETALAVAQELLTRAEQQGDTTALLMGHRVLGMSLFVIGKLEEARQHLRKAIELYEPKRHAPLALIFSHDFKATAETYLGLATAIAGSPEDGIRHCISALAYAEELRHPHSICYVLPFLAGAYLVAGNADDALPVAERTMALSNEYGFPQWLAGGLLLRGWAHIEQGKIGEGLEDICSSINWL
jgi:predicted ATPase